MIGNNRRSIAWQFAVVILAFSAIFVGQASYASETIDVTSEEAVSESSDTEEGIGEVELSPSEETSVSDEAEVQESNSSEDHGAAEEVAPEPEPVSDENEVQERAQTYKPVYSVHVQDIGWTKSVSAGRTAGTVGKAKRIEALRVSLEGSSSGTISVLTQAHFSGIGWQNWVDSSTYAGTTGQSRAIEALRIKLPDDLAQTYSIWYRVHVSNYGWLDWACDGQAAGTVGYGYRCEALEIRLQKKGDPAPGATTRPFVDRSAEPARLTYRAHVSNIGWQKTVDNGAIAGTTSRALSMEALSASISWYGHSGSLELRSHVSGDGWQSWKTSTTGTTGRGRAIEAIQLRLTGELGQQYDIWYRVHAAGIGWMGWASNSGVSGTTGASRAIEAIQIKLLPKGSAAPGAIDNAYRGAYERLKGTATTLKKQSSNTGIATEVVLGKKDGPRLSSFSMQVHNKITEGSISYRAMSQFAGTQDWVGEGKNAGVAGDALKGVAFRLTGSLATVYDIWYQAYDSEIGWTGWGSNGANVGSAGSMSYISAVKVVLKKKGSPAPGSTDRAFVQRTPDIPHLVMQGHSATIGWGDQVLTGRCSGLRASPCRCRLYV